jgi:hypothetical protein
MNKARLFVRVVELGDGAWEVRRGRDIVVRLDAYAAALERAKELAATLAPSAVFVHRRDRSVTRLCDFD